MMDINMSVIRMVVLVIEGSVMGGLIVFVFVEEMEADMDRRVTAVMTSEGDVAMAVGSIEVGMKATVNQEQRWPAKDGWAMAVKSRVGGGRTVPASGKRRTVARVRARRF